MGNSLLWHLGSWLSSCLCIWFWSLKHTKKAVGKERQINVVARKSKLDFPSLGWSPGGQFFTPVWPWRYGCPTKARALHHEAKNTHLARQSETWKQGSSRGGVLRPHYSLNTSEIRLRSWHVRDTKRWLLRSPFPNLPQESLLFPP